MSLRKKTMLMIAGALIVALAVLSALAFTMQTRSFAALEEQELRQDVGRVLNGVSDELAELDVLTQDWSHSEDINNFMITGQRDLLRANLGGSTFRSLRLNLLLLVRPSGEIALSQGFDQASGQMVAVNATLQGELAASSLTRPGGRTGLLVLPGNAMLAAGYPITGPSGAAHGTLIMARYLDAATTARLANAAHLPVTFHTTGDRALPQSVLSAATLAPDRTPVFLQPLDEHTIAGFAVLRDIDQHPALVLHVDRARDIYQQGMVSTRYFVGALLVIGILLASVTVIMSDRMVVSRIALVSATINRVQATRDLTARVDVPGDDEVSRLGQALNDMLATVQQAQQERQESEAQLEQKVAQLRQAEEQIRGSLAEKEMLLREVNHRVKNNLQFISSMLSLQGKTLRQSPDGAASALDALKDSQSRIRSMALIHEKLYGSKDMARVDFTEYVRHLANYLFRAYAVNPQEVTLKTDLADIWLGLDMAVPCGLIINELVSNALKYAFPPGRVGSICVALRPAGGGRLALRVSDDGVGFPPGLNYRESTSLGLKLVLMLVEQLDGEISMEQNGGTTFCVTFAASVEG